THSHVAERYCAQLHTSRHIMLGDQTNIRLIPLHNEMFFCECLEIKIVPYHRRYHHKLTEQLHPSSSMYPDQINKAHKSFPTLSSHLYQPNLHHHTHQHSDGDQFL